MEVLGGGSWGEWEAVLKYLQPFFAAHGVEVRAVKQKSETSSQGNEQFRWLQRDT